MELTDSAKIQVQKHLGIPPAWQVGKKTARKLLEAFSPLLLITFVMSGDYRPHPGNRWASTFSTRLLATTLANVSGMFNLLGSGYVKKRAPVFITARATALGVGGAIYSLSLQKLLWSTAWSERTLKKYQVRASVRCQSSFHRISDTVT